VPVGKRKNTAGTIKKIRKWHAEGKSQAWIARKLGMPSSNVCLIVNNKMFKWVKADTPDHWLKPPPIGLKDVVLKANKQRRERVKKMQETEEIPEDWEPAIANSSLLLPDDCVRRLRDLRWEHDWLVTEISRFFGLGYQRTVKIVNGHSYKHVTKKANCAAAQTI